MRNVKERNEWISKCTKDSLYESTWPCATFNPTINQPALRKCHSLFPPTVKLSETDPGGYNSFHHQNTSLPIQYLLIKFSTWTHGNLKEGVTSLHKQWELAVVEDWDRGYHFTVWSEWHYGIPFRYIAVCSSWIIDCSHVASFQGCVGALRLWNSQCILDSLLLLPFMNNYIIVCNLNWLAM